jgi:hypothetical protein
MITASSSKKQSAPKPTDELACTLCKGVEGLDLSDFKKHRLDVHGDAEAGKLKMRSTLHLDGDDWFGNVYEILDGQQVVGTRSTSQPRRGENKRMRDAGVGKGQYE